MGNSPRIPPELTKRPFTLAEARAVGLSSRALEGKSWRRVGSGLYQWVGLEDDTWQILKAWQGRLPTAGFAFNTAAWIYRVDVPPTPIEVLVPSSSGIRSRTGLVVHRSAHCEFITVRGLRATSVARTFRDVKQRLSDVEYLVLADQAIRLGLGRYHELAEPAESPMETRLRLLLLSAGLPKPEVQWKLFDAAGNPLGRADLYYPSARLVIEYDGGNHRERMTEDLRRQNAVLAAGYQLLRFTAADLYQRPDAIVTQVRNALRSTSWH